MDDGSEKIHVKTAKQKPEDIYVKPESTEAVEAEAVETTEAAVEPQTEAPEMLPAKAASKESPLKKLAAKLKNKKVLAAVALVLVLGGGTAFMLMRDSGSESPVTGNNNTVEAAKITAKLSYFDGKVERKNGEFFTPLALNDELQEGDVLRTSGTSSRGTIALSNGSFVRLNADTKVTLISLRADEVVIMQENGEVYSRVSPASGGTHIVETNLGTYKALGTAYKTTSSGDEESVEVYDSQVEETQNTKTVSQGEKFVLKNTQDEDKVGDIVPLDIEEIKKDEFVSWCIDEDKKIAEFKDKLGFLSDTDGPKLDISYPANGGVITVEDDATSGSISFKGKTEKDATLTIKSLSVKNSEAVTVDLDDDGSFESEPITGIIGNSKFEVTAKDESGNKTVKTLVVVFKKKVATTSITLSNQGLQDGKYKVSWTLADSFSDGDGFKVVWNTTGSPVYGDGKSNAQFADASSRDAGIYLDKKKDSSTTYYIRVCRYTGSDCDSYSNQITITVPKKD